MENGSSHLPPVWGVADGEPQKKPRRVAEWPRIPPFNQKLMAVADERGGLLSSLGGWLLVIGGTHHVTY